MKKLILVLFILGCDSTPPTFDQIIKQKLNKCVEKCGDKYLDSVVIHFQVSTINNPRELANCLLACYE